MVTSVTAPRRLAVALAAFLAASPLVALPARSAPAELAPGSSATVVGDALLRSEPGYGAAAAGEVAPGAWTGVVSGPVYDADGNAWYQVDAGGFLPAGSLAPADSVGGDAGYVEAAQEVDPAYDPAAAAPVEEAVYTDAPAYEEAPPAEPVYDEPAPEQTWEEPAPEQTWEEPVAEEAVYQDPAAAPQDKEAAYDPAAGAPAGDQTAWQDPAAAPVEEAAPAVDQTAPAPEAAPAAPAYDPNTVVATAWIAGANGDGATCRSGADYGAGEIGWLGEGQQVNVIGDAVDGWQPVNCSGSAGFVSAEFLAWNPPAAPAPEADPAQGPIAEDNQRGGDGGRAKKNRRGDAGSAPAPAGNAGQQVADVAMQYVGYPYVYGAEGPYAFDCSGFTKYVFQQALGLDIGRDLFAQAGMGRQVSRAELQPGDMVFFQNTYRPGLSHNGIYIGNGQFVHAENESTGVKVSDIDADYYASRWYGAVRLT